VIIPTLNEAKTIARVIDAVRAADSQILVADGGSSDGTPAIAQAAGAAVIQAPRGRAAQQNAAVRHALGRVLLFLHADTRLPADYPAQVFETLMDPAVAAGAFRFKTDWDRPGMRLIERAAHLRAMLFQLPYGDQGLFMPKTVFDRAGGFPLVPAAEDLLLVRQLKKLGRIALARGAAVTSARRWRTIGIWRATLRNYLIAGGCLAGIDPRHLAPLYRSRLNRNASIGDRRDPTVAQDQRR
jgi:rSAM/selenodomain-associated transferase 2